MTYHFSKLFVVLPLLAGNVLCTAFDNNLLQSVVTEMQRHKLELFRTVLEKGISAQEGLLLAKMYDPQEGIALVDIALSLGKWSFICGLADAARDVQEKEKSIYPGCSAMWCPHRLSIHRRLLEIAGSENPPLMPVNQQDEIAMRTKLTALALYGTSRSESFRQDPILQQAFEKIFPGKERLSEEQHKTFADLCLTFHPQGPWFVAGDSWIKERIDKEILGKLCKY